jgi:hypothetical protein
MIILHVIILDLNKKPFFFHFSRTNMNFIETKEWYISISCFDHLNGFWLLDFINLLFSMSWSYLNKNT